jgi:hypothetical protein
MVIFDCIALVFITDWSLLVLQVIGHCCRRCFNVWYCFNSQAFSIVVLNTNLYNALVFMKSLYIQPCLTYTICQARCIIQFSQTGLASWEIQRASGVVSVKCCIPFDMSQKQADSLCTKYKSKLMYHQLYMTLISNILTMLAALQWMAWKDASGSPRLVPSAFRDLCIPVALAVAVPKARPALLCSRNLNYC